MASLVSLVTKRSLRKGDMGENVKAMQLALGMAGYRCLVDGDFGEVSEKTLKTFQMQHGLRPDGVCGVMTAGALDLPHEVVVATAQPIIHSSNFPHDDTASMVAFYGDPRVNNDAWQAANLVRVEPPWQMNYDGKPIKGIQIHKKVAPALSAALTDILQHFKGDIDQIHRVGMHNFSGSYNYRVVRGSSRLSTHAFGAGIDMDAARNPMTYDKNFKYPLAEVNPFFEKHGFYWGGNYKTRKDGMHWQAAHE